MSSLLCGPCLLLSHLPTSEAAVHLAEPWWVCPWPVPVCPHSLLAVSDPTIPLLTLSTLQGADQELEARQGEQLVQSHKVSGS